MGFLNLVDENSDVVSGWKSCEFKGIDSIEYADNNQKVYISWTYEVTSEDEVLTEETSSLLSMYDLLN